MEYLVMVLQNGYSCQFEMKKFIIFIYISETQLFTILVIGEVKSVKRRLESEFELQCSYWSKMRYE